MFTDSSHDPFIHASSASCCGACGCPSLPGINCLCEDFHPAGLSCATCGSPPGDYEASCPECRTSGRVETSLVSWLERSFPHHAKAYTAPPDELHAEEPLPLEPPRAKRPSYRPVAA